MNPTASNKKTLITLMLSLVSIGILGIIYFSSIWWVSLKAPNYPPEAFPDGVRIEFHMNGVFNGCSKIESHEIQEDEALDCVHEMDTINHYVGMYPIASGGALERAYSPFLITMLCVMLLGFACNQPKLRVGLMGVGFGAIIIWMYMTFYVADGFRLQNEGYVHAMVTSMDQDASDADDEEEEASGVIALLKKSLAASEGAAQQAPEPAANVSEKDRLVNSLKINFERDAERTGSGAEWDGSGYQVLVWHYEKSLGRYFNNQEEIVPMAQTLATVAHIIFVGLIAAMVLLLFGARKNGGFLYWLLILVPMGLPLFFLIDYAAWLWWYGHSMNAMGAFAVKPFMPTVFGDGKVAQFSTHSYPDIGFGLMILLSLVTAAAALVRRKQWKQVEH